MFVLFFIAVTASESFSRPTAKLAIEKYQNYAAQYQEVNVYLPSPLGRGCYHLGQQALNETLLDYS